MKSIKFILPLLVCIFLTSIGCNNSSKTETETESVKEDTAMNKDTIHVDPENFSDPH